MFLFCNLKTIIIFVKNIFFIFHTIQYVTVSKTVQMGMMNTDAYQESNIIINVVLHKNLSP